MWRNNGRNNWRRLPITDLVSTLSSFMYPSYDTFSSGIDFNESELCSWCNLGSLDMTCWMQLIHWESFKCLLMRPSDSPQLCCWMLRKTWANSVNSSHLSSCWGTLTCAALLIRSALSQMVVLNSWGVMLEASWWGDQAQVETH